MRKWNITIEAKTSDNVDALGIASAMSGLVNSFGARNFEVGIVTIEEEEG